MKILITGGSGFIGCNTAQRFLRLGDSVTVLDNLSRPGSKLNLEWLREQGQFEFLQGDVRDAAFINETIKQRRPDVCIHLAGQVAVTTSVQEPRLDFEINAMGTLNVLEAIREQSPDTILLNASTNKVYGKLTALKVKEEADRYVLSDLPHGVGEVQPLDFHSPYGCSKGAADQYVRDYSRIYGIRTVNFRQSCIYGYRQFGVEDQGWIAWFTIAHILGQPVTIYGNGKQVRDVLFIRDLIDGYLAAVGNIDKVSGMTFNIGGGPANTLSLLELLDMLSSHSGREVAHSFDDWRPGDQPVYISDISQAEELLSWRPQTGVSEGLERLYEWAVANQSAFIERAAKI